MKTVIEMALEAGFEEIAFHKEGDSDFVCFTDEIERFAELVRADEREQLINHDWTAIMRKGGLVTWGGADELGDRVIAAIRARSDK